jgi:hypothetical protein
LNQAGNQALQLILGPGVHVIEANAHPVLSVHPLGFTPDVQNHIQNGQDDLNRSQCARTEWFLRFKRTSAGADLKDSTRDCRILVNEFAWRIAELVPVVGTAVTKRCLFAAIAVAYDSG